MRFEGVRFKPFVYTSLIGSFVVGSVYGVPRGIVFFLGESHPFSGYLYSYILGSIFFILMMSLIVSVEGSKKDTRFWIRVLTAGLCWGVIFHGAWIWFSITYPFKGIL